MSTDSQQEVAAELKIQHGGLIEFEAGLSKVDRGGGLTAHVGRTIFSTGWRATFQKIENK